jgi:signal transduction histidine kinase
MGVPSSAGRRPPRGAAHSIGFYLLTRVTVPVLVLVLAWGALAALVLTGRLRGVMGSPGRRALTEAAVLAGAGLFVALITVVLIWAFARRLAREADRLSSVARFLADEQLPGTVDRLRQGSDTRAAQLPVPPPATRVTEFAEVGAALDRIQATALNAATSEARLRSGFRQVLTSLGRRNQSLLLRQLRIIDTLEQQAASPSALADLFTLDHLTTRMRRHADSLTVLSGAPAARPRMGPVPVIDVIRAAVAETEDYRRVVARTETEEAVSASAVNDLIHLLAELIENATLFSPSATKVEVRAERVANGFAIEVEDRGLGIAADQLGELNQRLASPPDFDLVDADRLGLFVAGLLAARHGIEVSLTPSPYRGTKAIVLLPDILIQPVIPEAGPAGAAALRLRSSNALSLVGVAAGGPGQLGPDEPGPDTAEPAPPAAPTTFHGLPRRVRGEKQPQPDTAERPAGPSRAAAPAPDDARRLAASLQRSWHRSRAADEDTPGSGQRDLEPQREPDGPGELETRRDPDGARDPEPRREWKPWDLEKRDDRPVLGFAPDSEEES